MGTERARFEDWLNKEFRGPRNAKLEAELFKTVDAFDEIIETGVIRPAQLKTLVNGASHPSRLLWTNVVDFLGRLSNQYHEVTDAIIEMSKSPKSNIRFSAICSLHKKTPTQIIDDVLKAGITDKSASVRWRAAQTALDLDRKNLVPEITKALSIERNANAKTSIEFSLLLLRDGYIVRSEKDGRIPVTVQCERGTISRRVPMAEFRKKGIEAIASEMRKSRF